MGLLVFFVETLFVFNEQSQIILVDLLFLIIPVFPDEAARLAVFRDHRLAELFIFINRIEVENEHSARVKVIIDQPEYLQKIFLFRDIIHGIADAHHGTHRTVKFKLPHILLQIQNIRT